MGDDAAAAAAAIPNPNRRQGGSSILLALKPRFSHSLNATTAYAQSKDGNALTVSLWVADPPELSLFSIDCTEPKSREPCDFRLMPHVFGADGPFVLLRAVLDSAWCRREYFLYKAGDSPSLKTIPRPEVDQGIRKVDGLLGVKEVGILGLGHGGHYLLAALRDAPKDDGYQLLIFSSETESWCTRALPNPCPGIDRVVPDKVITLGRGLLGWVDLSLGILVCDLLVLLLGEQRQDQDQPPATDGRASCFFIPLPEPFPGNKYPISPTQNKKEPSPSSSWFRDLTCVNGVLKFIEMENAPRSENKFIYGSDLIKSLKRKAVDGNPEQQLSCLRDAWRVVTWTWNLGLSFSPPSNRWRQTCAAHVADIKEGQQLGDFYSAFPVLSLAEEDGDDDILYLRSLWKPSDQEGSVLALDIRNKSLKAIGRYYLPDNFYYNLPDDLEHPFRACTLSRHLDMTDPGIQVSKCSKITEASRSCANQPSKTSIDLYSLDASTLWQTIEELTAKVRRELNQPESINVPFQPPQQCVNFIRPVGPGHSLRANQNNQPPQQSFNFIRPVGPVHSLLANQNKLPPQQCFNFIRPVGPGHSLWANQNNLPLQQSFNFIRPDGPGYASLAPVRGRHDYQPLWPPSKQQLTSSSESRPYEGGDGS